MSCRSLWLFCSILTLTSLPCVGGPDPNLPDTVRVECPSGYAFEPDSMAFTVYVWNDEPLSALSLGLRVVPEFPVLSSWRVIDGDMPPIDQSKFGVSYNADSNIVLLGWIDMSGSHPVAATTTSQGRRLVTLYFRYGLGSPLSVVRVDSTFVPPAAPFILVGPDGKFSPQFVGYLLFIDAIDQHSVATLLATKPDLQQNSPNPFNSSTTITFDIPRTSRARLDILNVLGENTLTLIDGIMTHGRHSILWEGRDKTGNLLPSGVYFYRLVVGDQVCTRKMVLLK